MCSIRGCLLAGLLATAMLRGQSSVSDARYAHLARGINLTRWFQYGSRIPITTLDRDLLLRAGFTCVRIPVAPQYLLYEWSSPERVERNLAALDKGIDMFLDAGMAVTLDFHADSEYLDSYLTKPGEREALVNIWRMLASRYANRNPDLLFFEIMNEPDNRFTEEAWDAEQRQVLAAIHEIAPANTVVLDAVNWSGVDALVKLKPYSDPNVIYAMHYYSPSTFTHQGADWTNQPVLAQLRGVPWPPFVSDLQNLMERVTSPAVLTALRQYKDEDWDAGRIGWDMGLAAAWAKRWGVRVVVNEFGDFKPFSPRDSRVRWLHDVRTAIEARKLGWAMWDYAAGFDLTVLNDGVRSIDPAVGAALGLESAQPWTLAAPVRSGSLPGFSSLRTVQLGAQPDTAGFAEGILAADVNGDGLPDLVVAPAIYPELPELPVRFFLNAGGGILTPGQFDGPAPVQRFVPSIVPGRFLGSLKRPGFFLPDTGPADGSGAQSKLLLPSGADRLRDATGNLPPEIVRTAGAAAGDVDGDGIDDLAVFHGGIEMLRNDGNGNFRTDPDAFPGSFPDAGHFTCGVFARRRGSSVQDLLAFGGSDAPARVFLNDGAGHFHDGALLPAPAGRPAAGGCAAVADLDGDGNPDVIVAYTEPDAIRILMNNGDGTFRDETALRMPALPESQGGIRRISVVRNGIVRNGKNKTWMLVVTRVGIPPLIEVARGDGTFAADEWQPATGPWEVAPGDFNGDGLPDLVFAQGGGSSLAARFGQAPSAPPR